MLPMMISAAPPPIAEASALGQDGEQGVDGVQRPTARPAEFPADLKILLDTQRGEKPPSFSHKGDAAPQDLIRREPAGRLTPEADGVPGDGEDGGNCAPGRLAQRAVACVARPACVQSKA